ncbi:MAG: DUF362 domain-containing protein [Deltaproteobacteria bacterium]|nr:DUF362 domain-containing protein [Deltaproteobacteria bacterium]
MRWSRRSFIQSALSAAALALWPRGLRAQPAGRSRVVVVRDGRAWTGRGWTDTDLDAGRVEAMIARALRELVGLDDEIEALRILLPDLVDARVAIKVNCVNRALPTHPRFTDALAALITRAGAQASQLLVYDRSDHELARCGYALGQGERMRVVGCDHAGYGYEQEIALGEAALRLGRIATEADHLLSAPVLKQHEMAGVTLSLKNHFGSIDHPELLHGRDRQCSPGIAELNACEALRSRSRLALVDALFGSFASGLAGEPDFAPMAVIASVDPVAADAVGQALINARREEQGLGPVDAVHLRDAQAAGLGCCDLERIERIEIELAPVEEQRGETGCGPTGRPGAAGLVALLAPAALRARRSRKSFGIRSRLE